MVACCIVQRAIFRKLHNRRGFFLGQLISSPLPPTSSAQTRRKQNLSHSQLQNLYLIDPLNSHCLHLQIMLFSKPLVTSAAFLGLAIAVPAPQSFASATSTSVAGATP